MTLREALDILELNPNTLDRTILENSLKKHLEGIELRNVMRLLEAYRKANAFINPTLATHGDVRVTMIDEPVPDGPPLNMRPAAKRLAEDNPQRLKRDFASGATFDESILKAPASAIAPIYDPKAFETQEMMIGEILPPPSQKAEKNIAVVPVKHKKGSKQSAAGFWGMVVLGGAAAASLGYFGASQLLPLLGSPNSAVSAQLRPAISQPTTSNVATKPTTSSVATKPTTSSVATKPTTSSVATKPTTSSVKPVAPQPNTSGVSNQNPSQAQAVVSSNTVSSSATKPVTPSTTKPVTPSTTKPTINQTTTANTKPVVPTDVSKLEAARLAQLEIERQAKRKADRAAKLEAERLAQAKLKADQVAAAQAQANRQAALLAQRQAAQQAAQRLSVQREAQRLAAQRQAEQAARRAAEQAARRAAEQAAIRRTATQAAARRAPVVSVRAINQGSFSAWDRSGAVLRYASWSAIPDSVRALPPAQFRASVYVASSPATLPGIPR